MNSMLDTGDNGWQQGRAGGDQASTKHFYSSFFSSVSTAEPQPLVHAHMNHVANAGQNIRFKQRENGTM
jgi:hypothetical protein